MDNPRNRLEGLKNLVLSVANQEEGQLNFDTLPSSKLELSEELLNTVPHSLQDGEISPSLSRGFEYFAPGMRTVILGCKNQVLPYIAAKQVYPDGTVFGCFSDSTVFEEFKEKFTVSINNLEQLAEIQLHYIPNGDLKIRYSEIEKYLENHPINELKNYWQLEDFVNTIKNENPLFPDNSIDIVALDALNFAVSPQNFGNIITGIYRVLKKGGIFLFSLMLSDERALEEEFLCEADLEAITGIHKFYGLHCLGRTELPIKIINGKEIRIHNFVAFKGKEGGCIERNQAVIYNGPWKEIRDDDGHIYPRGKRVAVCDKTFNILLKHPYKGQFTYINPYIEISLENAADFPCCAGILFRDPKVTKGLAKMNYSSKSQDCCGTATNQSSPCCSPGESDNSDSCCC